MTQDRTAVAATLAAKGAELEADLAALSAPVDDQGGISFGKRVGDGTSMAVERLSTVAVHERLQDTLTEVVRAQEKLAEGSYGTCDRCGEPIPADRLDALPWATLCVADAAVR
jgi:DnaK suppressor protein